MSISVPYFTKSPLVLSVTLAAGEHSCVDEDNPRWTLVKRHTLAEDNVTSAAVKRQALEASD